MVRTISALVCSLAVVLMGATGPAGNAPVAVVYPLVPSGKIDGATGARLAASVGAQLALRGISVKATPGDIPQARYIEVAREAGADYYVSGFASPTAGGIAAAFQVVSLRSGTLVWGGTITLADNDDGGAAAAQIGRAIVEHATRGFASVGAGPVPAAAPTVAPTVATLPVPTRRDASPTPAPAVVVTPAAAAPGSPVPAGAPILAVFNGGGEALAERSAYLSDALALALAKKGQRIARIGREESDLTKSGLLLCSDPLLSNNAVLMLAPLSRTAQGENTWLDVHLWITKYDCRTNTSDLIRADAAGFGGWKVVADRAIDGAVTSLLGLKPARR